MSSVFNPTFILLSDIVAHNSGDSYFDGEDDTTGDYELNISISDNDSSESGNDN